MTAREPRRSKAPAKLTARARVSGAQRCEHGLGGPRLVGAADHDDARLRVVGGQGVGDGGEPLRRPALAGDARARLDADQAQARTLLAERRPQPRGHGLPLGVTDPQFQGGIDRRFGRDGAQHVEVAGDLALLPVVVHAAVEQRPAPLGLEAGADARPGEPGGQGGVERAVEGQAQVKAAPPQAADQAQVRPRPPVTGVRVELDDLIQVRVVLQQQAGVLAGQEGDVGVRPLRAGGAEDGDGKQSVADEAELGGDQDALDFTTWKTPPPPPIQGEPDGAVPPLLFRLPQNWGRGGP